MFLIHETQKPFLKSAKAVVRVVVVILSIVSVLGLTEEWFVLLLLYCLSLLFNV
jgi:hypothetical protein